MPPRTALKLTGALVLAIYGVQLGLAVVGAPPALAVVLGDAAAIALLWAWRVDVGFVWPRARFVVAAVLGGLACWYPAAKLVEVVSPPGDSVVIQTAIDKGPLIVPLACLGIVPAFAEELVFRGVLARSFAQRGAALAIVVSAVAFSAYHLAPAQMLGTLPLAFVLGVLAVGSGSVVPGMVAHLLNNAIVIVLERDEVPALGRALVASPPATLACTSALVAAAVVLAMPRGKAA
ncbi:MAG: CPBP family intramembrane metalloprotease [Deltaproteobacteria bacterium]|nr:CPBP family intramembrane metalloprotease [Deltaproteobacteria bacterium]